MKVQPSALAGSPEPNSDPIYQATASRMGYVGFYSCIFNLAVSADRIALISNTLPFLQLRNCGERRLSEADTKANGRHGTAAEGRERTGYITWYVLGTSEEIIPSAVLKSAPCTRTF